MTLAAWSTEIRSVPPLADFAVCARPSAGAAKTAAVPARKRRRFISSIFQFPYGSGAVFRNGFGGKVRREIGQYAFRQGDDVLAGGMLFGTVDAAFRAAEPAQQHLLCEARLLHVAKVGTARGAPF